MPNFGRTYASIHRWQFEQRVLLQFLQYIHLGRGNGAGRAYRRARIADMIVIGIVGVIHQ